MTADVHNLFLLYGREIQLFLTRRLACRDTAADLTQELFLRLMEPRATEDIRNVRAYLYRAAMNLALNHQAGERRREALWESEVGVDAVIADTHTPEHAACDAERLRAMAAALDELPPLARQVLWLTRIDGLKQAEVAKKLGVHITTVEKNLSRAVKHCYARAMEAEERPRGKPRKP